MMKTLFASRLLAVSCAVMSPVAAADSAQPWPAKPLRVIAPYGPGGGVDTFTRPLAAAVSRALGQPVIVENRPGAGGTIGVRAASLADADGLTLLSGGVHQPMAEGLYPRRGYELARDFVPVALTAYVPTVLVVNPSAPFQTVPELMAYVKNHPGEVNYCSSGNGTSQHLVAELFKRQTGLDITHIPYRGTAAAMVDLIGGQCALMFDGLGTSAGQIRGGFLRPLAMVTRQRSPIFPDVPTLFEAGGPALDATIWYGWWTRRGTPEAVVRRMGQTIAAALQDPAVSETWAAQGAQIPNMAYSDVDAYVHTEITRWTDTVKALGIALD